MVKLTTKQAELAVKNYDDVKPTRAQITAALKQGVSIEIGEWLVAYDTAYKAGNYATRSLKTPEGFNRNGLIRAYSLKMFDLKKELKEAAIEIYSKARKEREAAEWASYIARAKTFIENKDIEGLANVLKIADRDARNAYSGGRW